MYSKKLVVIGGGAAGFFCAVNAARMHPGLEVVILEKSSKVLSKVKVSGGGRCNVSHACNSISDMVAHYPRGASFLKKAFHHFFVKDTIHWFLQRGVELKTEKDGRMFPVTNDSQTIIDCLIREANQYHVSLQLNAEVKQITKDETNKFVIALNGDRKITADFVCVACGGYSKLSQFQWLEALGHSIEPPVPSLFTFNMPGNTITSLMGITVENAMVKIAGTKLQQQGAVLITHWGLSGPAILKLSAWGAIALAQQQYRFTAIVNWIPNYNEQTLKEKLLELRFSIASQKIYNRNPFGLPSRLWEYLLQETGIGADIRWADLPAKEQNKLIKTLCNHEFAVNGKTTFKEEFVTAGGIRLDEIDVNTMESKKQPGLFFGGEIMNVDGVTGGFNFQHAWTSGWLAAKGVMSYES